MPTRFAPCWMRNCWRQGCNHRRHCQRRRSRSRKPQASRARASIPWHDLVRTETGAYACAHNEEQGLRSDRKRGPSAAITATLTGMLILLLFSAACKTSKDNTGVMATVNGRKITGTEVDKYFNNQTADAPQKPTDEQADTLRLNILKQLIDNEILMQRAEKLGLLATDDEVNSKLAEIKAPFSQEDFDKRLAARNITLADVKHDIRQQLTIQKVLNKEVGSKVNISDQDITAYYNQHKAEFNLIEPQYRLAQILVTTQPNPQTKTPEKAQNQAEAVRKIQMVHNRLDSGEDFATDAMK